MTANLEIRLTEGSPALADHRVSLAEFGPALKLLLSVVREATRRAHRDSGAGRLPFNALQIDVEVEEIVPNCATLKLAVVRRVSDVGDSSRLLDILEAGSVRAANDIQEAARGESSNRAALKFIRALPQGTRATYVVIDRNGKRREFDFARTDRADTPLAKRPPVLRSGLGRIMSICVKEGSESVTIRTADYGELQAETSQDMARAAVKVAFETIDYAVVGSERAWKLLRIRSSASEERTVPSMAEITNHISTRWGRTMELLAQ